MVFLQDGWQAFHVAAHNGHLETIKVLVKGGVEHNCVNKVMSGEISLGHETECTLTRDMYSAGWPHALVDGREKAT